MTGLFTRAVAAVLVLIVTGCATTQPYPTSKDVTSFAFSPSETLLAVANASEIQLYDAESMKYLGVLRVLPADLKEADPLLFRNGVADSLAFLDENRIATTGMGGLVTIWNVHSGRCVTVIDPLPSEEFASTIEYSPASNQLAIGTSKGQVLLTTITGDHAGTPLPLAKLEGYIYDLQFSRNGRYIASASLIPDAPRKDKPTEDSAETFIREVDGTAGGTPPAKPEIESAEDFAQNMNSKTAAGSNVVIWDADRREKLGILKGAEGVLKMALVPGETALITAGEKVQIWEFLTQKHAEDISDPNMVLQGIGMGALAVASLATLSVGAMPSGDFLANSLLSGGYPFIPSNLFIKHACSRTAAISPDGRTIVSTTRGPTLNVMSVIDRKENRVVEKWTAHSAVCGLRFSRDGKELVEANTKGIYVYDTKSWKKSKLRYRVGALH